MPAPAKTPEEAAQVSGALEVASETAEVKVAPQAAGVSDALEAASESAEKNTASEEQEEEGALVAHEFCPARAGIDSTTRKHSSAR